MNNWILVSTPLQYINALNIDLDKEKCNLVVVDLFSNKGKLAEVVQVGCQVHKWQQVYYFRSKTSAILFLIFRKIHCLYIDSDKGKLLSLLLFLKRHGNLYTYEEGYGSYLKMLRSDQYYIWPIGANKYIKGRILYFPEIFRSLVVCPKPIITFRTTFQDHMKSIFEFKNPVINHNDSCKIEVYLTDWKMNFKIFSLLENDTYKILKPHPQSIFKLDELSSTFNCIIDSIYPAEKLIQYLKQLNKEVVVYHENSTTLLYFQETENIRFINLAKNKSDYVVIKKRFEENITNQYNAK